MYSGSNRSMFSLDNHTPKRKNNYTDFQNLIKLQRFKSHTCNGPAELALRQQRAKSPRGWGPMAAPARAGHWPQGAQPPHSPTVGVAASSAFRCTKAFLKSLSVPSLLQPLKKKKTTHVPRGLKCFKSAPTWDPIMSFSTGRGHP